jgi:hypothetical protein
MKLLAAAGHAASAADLSGGADSFYRGDKVDSRAASFKNQYGMRVAGTLFRPKSLDRKAKAACRRAAEPKKLYVAASA